MAKARARETEQWQGLYTGVCRGGPLDGRLMTAWHARVFRVRRGNQPDCFDSQPPPHARSQGHYDYVTQAALRPTGEGPRAYVGVDLNTGEWSWVPPLPVDLIVNGGGQYTGVCRGGPRDGQRVSCDRPRFNVSVLRESVPSLSQESSLVTPLPLEIHAYTWFSYAGEERMYGPDPGEWRHEAPLPPPDRVPDAVWEQETFPEGVISPSDREGTVINLCLVCRRPAEWVLPRRVHSTRPNGRPVTFSSYSCSEHRVTGSSPLADPSPDYRPANVYADWLDEQGYGPAAAALRKEFPQPAAPVQPPAEGSLVPLPAAAPDRLGPPRRLRGAVGGTLE